MADQRIGVIGICALNAVIGPKGNHLRWTFPRERGFPPKGFQVFRRETKKFSEAPLNFSGLPLNVDLPNNVTIDNVQFSTHPAASHLRCRQSTQERLLQVRPSAGAQVELQFFEPIVHLHFELSGSGFGALRAFSGKRLVAQVTSGGPVREVFCQDADRAIIDLGAGEIRSIRFTTQSTACNFNDWQLLKKLPLPTSVDEALKLLEPNLKNHYAPDVNTARVRYKPSASEIVTWLKRLLSPTAEFFTDPEAQPHLLQVRSDDKTPTTATYPQSLFFLAALDPNVARMMCLYWVDAFEPAAQAELPPPNSQSSYDYKVEGDWNDGDPRCGLLLNLGQPSAPLPAIQPKVTGKQLEGLRWLKAEAHGRIGLKWPKPTFDASPQAAAVQPVVYDITRVSDGREVRIKEPILVDNLSWEKTEPVLYIDRDLRVGAYTYKVRPIDLFGQVGAALQSDPIKIEDNVAPPPPVRTRNFLEPKSDSASLLAQFEFGAAQHEQAPDIKHFQPYWRADTLLDRRDLKVVLAATEDRGENLVHTLRISNADSSSIPFNEIETFAGDVITNVVSSASETIAVENRRRFRIARAVAPDRVVLEPTVHPIANGTYELVRDPHNKAVWNRLAQKIKWREPVTGLLKATSTELRAEALTITIISPRPDPFASIPPEARARNHPEVEPAPEVLEIQIDRVLTEPDVFAGGAARVSGSTNEFKLIYVVANLAKGRTTIALPATATVAAGDTLILSPAPSVRDAVRVISIEGTVDRDRLLMPGGEVAFESSVARVISNAVNRAGFFELVVRAENAQSIRSLRSNRTSVRYYAPFALTVDVAASTSVAAPISIPVNPAAGRRDGFITFSSIDERDLEGPLGTASQFTLILPGPTGAPSKPYPCGMDASAVAGYASPPNRAGRSTICLEWDLGSLHPTEGLRFEVARALDNGILSAHLSSWKLGKNQPLGGPVIPGISVNGTLDEIQPANGLIRATLTITTPLLDAAEFRNGRLLKDGVYFQVTVANSSGTTIDLLLRGPSPLSSGQATLEAPPDYSAVKTDAGALQNLALETPDAFALVTGVPVDVNRFVDDVAGKGQNRFLYRVRAVDAAENRSDWSPLSAPFYQLDTSPPPVPRNFRVIPGRGRAMLVWESAPEPISGFYIYRSLGGSPQVTGPRTDTLFRRLAVSDVSRGPIQVISGRVTLPIGCPLPRDSATELHVFELPNGTVDLFVQESDLTRLQGWQVVNVNPLATDGTPVQVFLSHAEGTLVLTRKPGTEEPLMVQNKSIDFSFGLGLSAVEGVFLAQRVNDSSDLVSLAREKGFLMESGVEVESSLLRITGLGTILAEDTAVAVLVRLSTDALRVIRYEPGTENPLVVKNGAVNLDLRIQDPSLVRVEKRAEQSERPPLPNLSLDTVSSVIAQSETSRVLTGLNPLVPNGTAVRLSYRTNDNELHDANGNPAELSWMDNDLSRDNEYHYAIAFVREVTIPGSTPQEPSVVREIVGAPTEFVKARVL